MSNLPKLKYRLRIWWYCWRRKYSLDIVPSFQYFATDKECPEDARNMYAWGAKYILKYFKNKEVNENV